MIKLIRRPLTIVIAAVLLLIIAGVGVHSYRLEHDPSYLAKHLDGEWLEALQEKVAKSDRIRVLNEVSDLDDPVEAAVLTNPAEIGMFMERFVIEVPDEFGHCMCKGHIQLEFYMGDRQLAQVSVHHGDSARWEGWPGDAGLTVGAANHLADLLATHGFSGFRENLDHLEKRRKISRRRIELQRSLMTPALANLTRAGGTTVEEVQQAFDLTYELSSTRARKLFEILGCTKVTWQTGTGYDSIWVEAVEELDVDAMIGSLEASIDDHLIIRGASYGMIAADWFLDLPHEIRERALKITAIPGLQDGRAANRRTIMLHLFDLDTGWARGLIRDVLFGKITPEPLSAEEEIDPYPNYGSQLWARQDHRTRLAESDSSVAALMLAATEGKSIRPRVVELIERADAAEQTSDQRILRQALDRIDGIPQSGKWRGKMRSRRGGRKW